MANGGIIGPVNDPTPAAKTTTFTASGTFNTSPANTPGQVDYLVIAGGGGGGSGGGGGAGGYRTSFPGGTKLTVSGSYPVTVGAGGNAAGPLGSTNATNGSPSIFSTITSAGGGFGGSQNQTPRCGNPGGSAGGGAASGGGVTTNGGTGNTPPVSPPQGNNGAGNGGFAFGPIYQSGGGGGAGAAGQAAQSAFVSGAGGVGLANSITGSPVFYAGGGGGGGDANPGGTGGAGGNGGGGIGNPSGASTAGTANTGGGGGGGWPSAAGGSGVVIIQEPAGNRAAPGVWSLQEQYNLKKNNQWSS